MADSLAVLRSSPKILNLALLVVGYGVSHRLFEFAWKGQLRSIYPSAQAYQVCCTEYWFCLGTLSDEGTPLTPPDSWWIVGAAFCVFVHHTNALQHCKQIVITKPDSALS